jgi:hypothetical protein
LRSISAHAITSRDEIEIAMHCEGAKNRAANLVVAALGTNIEVAAAGLGPESACLLIRVPKSLRKIG